MAQNVDKFLNADFDSTKLNYDDPNEHLSKHEKLLIDGGGKQLKTQDIHDNLVVDERLDSYKGVYNHYGQDEIN